MPTSYGALCSDFYVNSKLAVKLDLPTDRETVLELFGRVRKQHPQLRRFKRYQDELALESPSGERGPQQWLSLRRTCVRVGTVAPDSLGAAYALHRLVMESAPFYLTISPLDVAHVEVVFGFDLDAPGNHHAIVHNALIAGSPLAALIDAERTTPVDVQPYFGVALNKKCDVQAFFEIKTRTSARQVREGGGEDAPISVYLTVRSYAPVEDVKALPALFESLAQQAERLADTRVAPHVLNPLREAIASRQY